jgi:hypothetical protein
MSGNSPTSLFSSLLKRAAISDDDVLFFAGSPTST